MTTSPEPHEPQGDALQHPEWEATCEDSGHGDVTHYEMPEVFAGRYAKLALSRLRNDELDADGVQHRGEHHVKVDVLADETVAERLVLHLTAEEARGLADVLHRLGHDPDSETSDERDRRGG